MNAPGITPPGPDAEQLKRVSVLVTSIAERLRTVCAGLPDAEFDALVRQIAETTAKYEALESGRGVRRRVDE